MYCSDRNTETRERFRRFGWILLALALPLPLTPIRVQAQTTNTFSVLNVNFRLTARVQTAAGTLVTTSIRTKDLIQAIGQASTNTFSSKAKLLLFFPVGGGVPFFVVRDGTNDFDAGGFLFPTQVGTPVMAVKTDPTGRRLETIRVTEEFKQENTATLNFDVQGFNTNQQDTKFAHQSLSVPAATSINVSVVGVGKVGGQPAVLEGTVTASGRQLEVHAAM
jgi:hypothetical protein